MTNVVEHFPTGYNWYKAHETTGIPQGGPVSGAGAYELCLNRSHGPYIGVPVRSGYGHDGDYGRHIDLDVRPEEELYVARFNPPEIEMVASQPQKPLGNLLRLQ